MNGTLEDDDGRQWLKYVKERRIGVDVDDGCEVEALKRKGFVGDAINKDILWSHIKHTRRFKTKAFMKGKEHLRFRRADGNFS